MTALITLLIQEKNNNHIKKNKQQRPLLTNSPILIYKNKTVGIPVFIRCICDREKRKDYCEVRAIIYIKKE